MPSVILVAADGRRAAVAQTPAELFADRRVVAARVNGELRDLATELSEGDEVEPVAIDSPDGLTVLRHSAAHVLAQAVLAEFPGTRLGIGPAIADGFYYDFDVARPFTPEDVDRMSKRMRRIVEEGQVFSRRAVTDEQARAEFAQEPYKRELIAAVGAVSSEEAPEVAGDELTVYDNLDARTGELRFADLCRGPHVPTTRHIPAFKLTRIAAAYWRGDERNPQLQRVYGTAWQSAQAQADYLHMLEEAEKRDHRRLGVELDLFSFPEEIGSGLAVFHPRGGVIRREMETYSQRRHESAGYEFVTTPHVSKSGLFQVSGHLDWYRDGMYPPMHMDEERDHEGIVRRAGSDYYLKPMNCPMHNLIYKSRGRSYRELPLRLFEFGTVYRHEKSGVVHGLTRARGFTQDDAHIYCTKEQMPGELDSLLSFVLDLLRDYGMDDFYLELSTRDPDKSVGSDVDWDEATAALAASAARQNLVVVSDEGGAAFYGPKISVQAKDAIGRYWQLSTIQLDFQLPSKFDLEYQAADGTRQRPVMIHRALFGSIERFFAVLLEHYAGAFPPWLAPVQVVGIPVAGAHVEYLAGIVGQLRSIGVRAEVDSSAERMPKKVRRAQKQKVPFMLIAGDDDMAAAAVSFRFRDGSQRNGVEVSEAIAEIKSAIDGRVQV